MNEQITETKRFTVNKDSSAETPEPLAIGSGVVRGVLGKGGTAVVYEIWNPKMEIFRAVKLWRIVNTQKIIQRFENEIKITSKLHHPNIVEIYAVGEWKGLPFIEMEKIDGEDLKSFLFRSGTLPPVVATAIAIMICRALVYAHNHEYTLAGQCHHGVVHCDLKPANVMISQNGVIKLMDFGIAHPSSSVAQSEKKTITGSLQYMSPEQLQSKSIDSRSDLYSLGVLLYELYSGNKAFSAKSLEELVRKRNHNDFVQLTQLNTRLSSKITDLIGKCMELDPIMRYQEAQEVYDALNRIFKSQTRADPKALIAYFTEGRDVYTLKPNLNVPRILKIVSLTIVPLVTLIVVLNLITRDPSIPQLEVADAALPKSSDAAFSVNIPKQSAASLAASLEATAAATLETDPIDKLPVSKTVGTDKQKPDSKVSPTNNQNTKSSQISKESKISPVPVTNEEKLDEMLRLINEGNLVDAERKIKEFPIKDGEYHLISAELYLKQSNWASVLVEADKALRISATRISPSDLREKVLVLKAKAFTAEFDKTKDQQRGQAAMEAWFDVKYIYRAKTTHPLYLKADKEIRRINEVL